MKKREEKSEYQSKKDSIITIIMIIFLILESIALIASYIFSILKEKMNIVGNNYNPFFILYNASFILMIVCSIINAILLFVLIILSSQEEDYDKYKDYVFVAKEDIKNYKKEFNKREKYFKEKIKLLKSELKNK